jgi:hypothetical protein
MIDPERAPYLGARENGNASKPVRPSFRQTQ